LNLKLLIAFDLDRLIKLATPQRAGFLLPAPHPSTEGCAINGLSVIVWTVRSKAVTYTVILVAGQQTQPLRTIEADSADQAWGKALID